MARKSAQINMYYLFESAFDSQKVKQYNSKA